LSAAEVDVNDELLELVESNPNLWPPVSIAAISTGQQSNKYEDP
jgi:hypothetical protein